MLANTRPPQEWFCIFTNVVGCYGQVFLTEEKTVIVNNQHGRMRNVVLPCYVHNGQPLDVHYRTSKHRNDGFRVEQARYQKGIPCSSQAQPWAPTVYQAREWWFQRRSDGRGTSRYGKSPVLITIAAQPRSPDWAFPKQAGCQATIELQL